MSRNASANAFLCFMLNLLSFSKFGTKLRWRYFIICFSKISTTDGRTNMTVRMPNTTPFAITKPISNPSPSFIKHRARNPKTVVSELPMSAVNEFATASAIASSRVSNRSFSSA